MRIFATCAQRVRARSLARLLAPSARSLTCCAHSFDRSDRKQFNGLLIVRATIIITKEEEDEEEERKKNDLAVTDLESNVKIRCFKRIDFLFTSAQLLPVCVFAGVCIGVFNFNVSLPFFFFFFFPFLCVKRSDFIDRFESSFVGWCNNYLNLLLLLTSFSIFFVGSFVVTLLF